VTPVLADAVRGAVDIAAQQGSSTRLVDELTSLARFVAGSPSLARALSDTDVDPVAKRAFLVDLTQDLLLGTSIDLVVKVAELRGSASAFASQLVDVSVEAAFMVAEHEDRLEGLEHGMHGASMLVSGNTDLRQALTNPAADDATKDALIVEILRGKVDDLLLAVVRLVVGVDHGRGIEDALEELARQAAARRGKVVADVRTAIELDDDQRARLTEALGRVAGQPVAARFSVDPSIVGSVIARIGDEVVDGSVRTRLEQARASLAGAQ